MFRNDLEQRVEVYKRMFRIGAVLMATLVVMQLTSKVTRAGETEMPGTCNSIGNQCNNPYCQELLPGKWVKIVAFTNPPVYIYTCNEGSATMKCCMKDRKCAHVYKYANQTDCINERRSGYNQGFQSTCYANILRFDLCGGRLAAVEPDTETLEGKFWAFRTND